MEASERKILPLPKRRVASAQSIPANQASSALQPSITPTKLFNKLHSLNDEVLAISEALSDQKPSALTLGTELTNEVHNVNVDEVLHQHVGAFDEGLTDALDGSEFDDEDDDDSCTGCREWMENVKNKKKRKIPTSAVMGHTNTASSPVGQTHYGVGLSPSRIAKNKTRRRRTWDVSSELRPDAAFRNGRSSALASNVFANNARKQSSLFQGEFEFTCDSPVTRNLPAPPPASVEILPAQPISVATQTSPSLAAMDPILPPRHRRSKEEKEYDRRRLVAKQRRAERAKLKPGEKENIWICNFCEYESILGYPPLALMYAYNERMRQEKREAIKRKRLLDKARSKGKKKKKGQAAPLPPPPPPHDNMSTSLDKKITPTLQNGGKTGIDKSIGPGSTSCTCCDHRRDKEQRVRRHRERHVSPVEGNDYNHGSIASDGEDATRSSSHTSPRASDLIL